ncbi:MAG TPA: protocatechuate 3,4-dioxygenase [Planctomycetota bacterium]|nr:protocatechuate 3,4-dioxygenase [Planctomycetota bacterium]
MNELSRRGLIRAGAAGLGLAATGVPLLGAQDGESPTGAFAEQLVRTPRQTEGPFYPDRLPLDTDNELRGINDSISPAVGVITHFGGRVLGTTGNPLRNVVVEIWQVDNGGAYLHRESGNAEKRDPNFQGFGRFLTGSSGEYYFRTIKPVAYPGRTPHIHVMLKRGGKELLTTQCYIRGEPRNARDGILMGIRDPKARESVIVEFAPLQGSTIGELAARFDIVLGVTPESR